MHHLLPRMISRSSCYLSAYECKLALYFINSVEKFWCCESLLGKVISRHFITEPTNTTRHFVLIISISIPVVVVWFTMWVVIITKCLVALHLFYVDVLKDFFTFRPVLLVSTSKNKWTVTSFFKHTLQTNRVFHTTFTFFLSLLLLTKVGCVIVEVNDC